jgi:predicted phage baseplate assembly protein
MPITIPSLDDRSFDDLVGELVARIPAHTPEWTNPRPGDPGRTLIELFAWLGDTLLYRANLIPERQRRVFLKLLGQKLRPAQPARGLITLNLPDSRRDPVKLRPRARIAKPVPFETLGEVTVFAGSGVAYLKRRLTDEEKSRQADVIDGLRDLYGVRRGEPYFTTPAFPDNLGSAGGVDLVTDSIDQSLWFALLAPRSPQPAEQAAVNERVRQQLGAAESGAQPLLNVGIVPAIELPQWDEATVRRLHVPQRWEMSYVGAKGGTDYQTLEVVADSTLGLRRRGVVRLALPPLSFIGAASNDVHANPRAGVGAEPPRLDADEEAKRLVAWLRLRPDPGAEALAHLRLSYAGVHAVEIEQRESLGSLVIGVSDGSGDQTFALPARQVDADSLVLEVEEAGRGFQAWTRVDDLGALVGPDSRDANAYELDAEAGAVRFGDGVRGRAPGARMRVRVAALRAGGGAAGNLAPATLKELNGEDLITRARVTDLKLQQPIACDGGAEAESLDEAAKRIPQLLRSRDRCVTREDYRSLAQAAPGVAVGRVEVLPGFKPHTRTFEVPGVVAVVALPAQPGGGVGQAPNPRPDRPFIESVFNHLDARRPLTTELYVIGCEYVPLSLGVAVVLRDEADRDETVQALVQALRRLLWPLAPGGFDGDGWPLGKAVSERETEVEVARVRGIAGVIGLNLFERSDEAWRALERPSGGQQLLDLARWQLPELHNVVVAVGVDARVPTRIDAGAAAGGDSFAIPLVPEIC